MQMLKWSRTLRSLSRPDRRARAPAQRAPDRARPALPGLRCPPAPAPAPYTDVAVRVIDLDDESLERLGQWPWPGARGRPPGGRPARARRRGDRVRHNEGHYLTHSGGIAFDGDGNASEELGPFAQIDNPNVTLESITVETINDKKVLELKVNSNYYRANKFTLYSKDGNNLSLGKGQLLGSLGETPQMDYDIPAEDTGEILPDKHEAHITDEVDMFTFESKFEKGQLVMLLLESDKETHRYFISTSKGKRGAMCTGTFL